MFGNQSIRDFQLVNHLIYHQIQSVIFPKTIVRHRHFYLRMNIHKTRRNQTSFEVVFVNFLLAQTAKMILRSIGATHHCNVHFIKCILTSGRDRNFGGDGHANECRQRNGGRGMFFLVEQIGTNSFAPIPLATSLTNFFKNNIPLPPFLCLYTAFSASIFAADTTPELPEKHLPFLEKYCLECHDSLTEKGEVNLEDIPFQVTNIEEAELWQKVLNSMNSGEMPPRMNPSPTNTRKPTSSDALAQTMVEARRSLSDTGGEITMRRLNRREYQNTIEDILGIRVDASSLPADGGGNTFDTEGASQFISSDQIEQYLKIGRSAIDELFERQAAVGLESKVFRVEPEKTVNVKSRENMARQEETYKRYLLWKTEVDKVAFLPENAEALAKIREKYKVEDLKDSVRLYQNTELLKGTPDATKFGFRDDNDASFSYQGGYGRTHAYMKQYLEFPNSDQGTYLKLAWAIQRIDVLPRSKDVPPGTYKLRVRAGAVKDSDPSRHFIEIGHPQRVNQVPAGFAGKPFASLQVTGTEENPEIIETTIEIGSDTPREFGIQERQPVTGKRPSPENSTATSGRMVTAPRPRSGWIGSNSKDRYRMPKGPNPK